MVDQAQKLRNIMSNSIKNSNNKVNSSEYKAEILSITSGKGGVGKTNFTINLALSLRNLGYEVLVFDADIGLANVDVISGVITKHTIADLLKDNKDIFEIITDGPNGIKIISGGSGLREISLLSEVNFNRLLAEIEKLESHFDFIIIDTGAGISDTVLNFLMPSDEVILVTTPDPTSLTDGYALLKALAIYGYKGKLNVVVNMAKDRKEAEDVFYRLKTVANKFIMVDLEYLGFLYYSNIVVNAVRNQKPFVISKPNSQLTQKINIMALNITGGSKFSSNKIKKTFAQRLKEFLLREGE